jgi:hypothetical protein
MIDFVFVLFQNLPSFFPLRIFRMFDFLFKLLFSLDDIPSHGHVCVHHSSPPGDPNNDKKRVRELIRKFSHSLPHVEVDSQGHVELSKEEFDLLLKKTAIS